MTGSRPACLLGVDSFLSKIPILVFAIFGGMVADRRERRHIILTSQITQMMAALALVALVHTHRVRVGAALALSFACGCVRAFGGFRMLDNSGKQVPDVVMWS